MAENWLDGLNEPQRQAVLHDQGPLLIVAGAGAGKTTVITRRTARLIKQGAPPGRILVVTFTNKAARELRERLETLVGEQGRAVVAATFHSFVLRHLLRPYGERIDMKNVAILDDLESRTLFKEACEHLSAQEKQLRYQGDWSPAEMQAEMGLARAAGLSPAEYRKTIHSADQDAQFRHLVANAWEHYLVLMKKNNATDFDGILEAGLKLLREHEDLRRRMQGRFAQVMVDEYQDTNVIQSALIENLVGRHRNLCVVGDARQSIYRFRGSDVKIILDFQTTWPGARIIELPTNYRSTRAIVEAANRISGEMRQKVGEQEMVAGGQLAHLGDAPRYRELDTDREEAAWVAEQIQQSIDAGVTPNSIAVLYRNRGVKGSIEQALIERRIPYVVVGDLGFFQRKEIRDLMALLRVTGNDQDNLAWLRLLDTAKLGVSSTRVREESDMTGMPVVEILRAKAARKGKVAERVQYLLGAVQDLRETAAGAPDQLRLKLQETWETYLSESLRKAIKTQYGKQPRDIQDKALVNRTANVEQLMDLVSSETAARTYEEVLEDLVLLSADQQESTDQAAVSLMTIHASKGLEFDHIYLPALEDEILPGRAFDPEEVEEERRIFYVALTRAKRSATLSCARERRLYGQTHYGSPSRFLEPLRGFLNMEEEESAEPEPEADTDGGLEMALSF